MKLNKARAAANGPRTVLSLSAVGLTVAILAASIWVQSATSAGGGGSKGPGGGGGKKKPHTVQFSGDIASAAISVNLDPDKPLNNVSLDDFLVTFGDPDPPMGTGCCTDPADCERFAADWGGYDDEANNPWTGPMTIRKTRQGGSVEWHISYFEATNEVGGSINLVVQAVPNHDDPAMLIFEDARGLVSAPSSPDGGTTDGKDRCLTFTITATKIDP